MADAQLNGSDGLPKIPDDPSVYRNLDRNTETLGALPLDELETPGLNGSDVGHDDDAGDDAEQTKARESGWSDKDHWRGKPEDWVDAATFNRRAETFVPFLNKELKGSRDEIAALRKQVEALQNGPAKEWDEFKVSQAKIESQYQLGQLRQQLQEAKDNGDTAAESAILDKIIDFKVKAAAPTAVAVPATAAVDPRAQATWDEFTSKNAWATTDKILQRQLIIEVAALKRADPSLLGMELLNEAKDSLSRRYPEKFNVRRRADMVDMDGSHGSTTPTSGRTYGNLKKDYQASYRRYVDQNGMPKEDFLKNCPDEAFRS